MAVPNSASSPSYAPVATVAAGERLIADGRNVWTYDPDLQQAQVRPEDVALSGSPLMPLSSSAEVSKAFEIGDAGLKDGLFCVRVRPRGAEGDFRQAVLGFSGGELRQMILGDEHGQVERLTFSRPQRNAPVAAAEVSFVPPKGVDVIGTPQ
jgi:outer membrane lipoprotein carrier protein